MRGVDVHGPSLRIRFKMIIDKTSSKKFQDRKIHGRFVLGQTRILVTNNFGVTGTSTLANVRFNFFSILFKKAMNNYFSTGRFGSLPHSPHEPL